MIKIYNVTSDPDYVDEETLVYDNFSHFYAELYCLWSIDMITVLENMANELAEAIKESPDEHEVIVYRHLGNDVVINMAHYCCEECFDA